MGRILFLPRVFLLTGGGTALLASSFLTLMQLGWIERNWLISCYANKIPKDVASNPEMGYLGMCVSIYA
jgi:hypothetical protein